MSKLDPSKWAGSTPGPWIVRERKTDPDEFKATICGGGFILADLYGPAYAHQEPNARLMAAAPDLAARVEELEAENERLRKALHDFLGRDWEGNE